MEALHIVPDLEVSGFQDGVYGVVEHKGPLTIGGMGNGTENGKPVVMIGLANPEEGEVLIAQTTLALFLNAADVLKAKYGDPRK